MGTSPLTFNQNAFNDFVGGTGFPSASTSPKTKEIKSSSMIFGVGRGGAATSQLRKKTMEIVHVFNELVAVAGAPVTPHLPPN